MLQTNTNANNGLNRNQNSRRGGRGRGAPNSSGRGDRRNDRGNKSIVQYSFEGKMKDGPIPKLTITKTGHRPSQSKKICNALPLFCADKTTMASMKSSVQYVTRSKMTSCRLILTPNDGLPHTTYKSPSSIQTSKKVSTQ